MNFINSYLVHIVEILERNYLFKDINERIKECCKQYIESKGVENNNHIENQKEYEVVVGQRSLRRHSIKHSKKASNQQANESKTSITSENSDINFPICPI